VVRLTQLFSRWWHCVSGSVHCAVAGHRMCVFHTNLKCLFPVGWVYGVEWAWIRFSCWIFEDSNLLEYWPSRLVNSYQRFFDTSVTFHQPTLRNIPEDWSLQLLRQNLKSLSPVFICFRTLGVARMSAWWFLARSGVRKFKRLLSPMHRNVIFFSIA